MVLARTARYHRQPVHDNRSGPQQRRGMSKTPSVKTAEMRRAKPVRAAIMAVHGYVPPDLLTNTELAKLVDTSDAWITERTGIKERHILKGKGLGTSHMGAEAVR